MIKAVYFAWFGSFEVVVCVVELLVPSNSRRNSLQNFTCPRILPCPLNDPLGTRWSRWTQTEQNSQETRMHKGIPSQRNLSI